MSHFVNQRDRTGLLETAPDLDPGRRRVGRESGGSAGPIGGGETTHVRATTKLGTASATPVSAGDRVIAGELLIALEVDPFLPAERVPRFGSFTGGSKTGTMTLTSNNGIIARFPASDRYGVP